MQQNSSAGGFPARASTGPGRSPQNFELSTSGGTKARWPAAQINPLRVAYIRDAAAASSIAMREPELPVGCASR